MIEAAKAVWVELLEGNRRFREGRTRVHSYTAADFKEIETEQHPKAAVIACSDSRVDPCLIFDQGIGDLFMCRVPGNIASESARWVCELAVGEFKVPLVVVLGHSGCLAVTGVADWQVGGAGGTLRLAILPAVMRAEGVGETRLAHAIRLNAVTAAEQLAAECSVVRDAVREGRTSCVAAIYEMGTGTVTEIVE